MPYLNPQREMGLRLSYHVASRDVVRCCDNGECARCSHDATHIQKPRQTDSRICHASQCYRDKPFQKVAQLSRQTPLGQGCGSNARRHRLNLQTSRCEKSPIRAHTQNQTTRKLRGHNQKWQISNTYRPILLVGDWGQNIHTIPPRRLCQ